jgi:hypothetical protein
MRDLLGTTWSNTTAHNKAGKQVAEAVIQAAALRLIQFE